MICPFCKQDIPDNSSFCVRCGIRLVESTENVQAENLPNIGSDNKISYTYTSKPTHASMNPPVSSVNQIDRSFYEAMLGDNEVPIMAIGKKWNKHMDMLGSSNKVNLLLTNVRLYVQGKVFLVKNSISQRLTEERTVDVNSISQTGFEHSGSVGWLILSVIMFLLTVAFYWNEVKGVGKVFAVIGVIFVICFFCLKKTYFTVYGDFGSFSIEVLKINQPNYSMMKQLECEIHKSKDRNKSIINK